MFTQNESGRPFWSAAFVFTLPQVSLFVVPIGTTLKTLFDLRSDTDPEARDVVGAISTKAAATSGG